MWTHHGSQTFPSSVFIWEIKAGVHRGPYTWMLTAALSVIIPKWKHLKYCQTGEQVSNIQRSHFSQLTYYNFYFTANAVLILKVKKKNALADSSVCWNVILYTKMLRGRFQVMAHNEVVGLNTGQDAYRRQLIDVFLSHALKKKSIKSIFSSKN